MRISLSTPIRSLPRIGMATEKLLSRVGVMKAEDFLHMYPIRYEDFRTIIPISHIKSNTEVCVKGKITLIANRRSPQKRMALTEALVTDETGSISVIWFNQGYLAKSLKKGDSMFFAGKVISGKYGMQLMNPVYEQASNNPLHMGRIVPIYHTTKDLSQKLLRAMVKTVLPLASQLKDPLPDTLRKQYRLMPYAKALEVIHFPVTPSHAKQAKERLGLQELIDIMLRLAQGRSSFRKKSSYAHPHAGSYMASMIPGLPFSLTHDQQQAMKEIGHDIEQPHPMNRMLHGDVGSGKTLIAHLAALAVANDFSQAALLAPTDILATQHMESLRALFPYTEGAALFTRTKQSIFTNGVLSPISKKDLLQKLRDGNISYCIGTHALIQKHVHFKRLGLVIIDEQHRFGVHQRATSIHLHESKTDITPHFLSLTATPIPRSLARIFFGGADISLLTEKPSGRKPIITQIISQKSRSQANKRIREQISLGHQAFVICPIIDESDTLGVKAATKEFERLQKEEFPDLKIGLVHGKLPQPKRDAAMRDFSENRINILVATAVVEVGVDVPNATVMLIEGAHRFGLAQLHQFRGRIGRSEHQSWCFASLDGEVGKERLQAFAQTSDGFELAKQDLRLRGPGTLFGILQSGYPELKLADFTDSALLKKSQEITKKLILRNP